ncbi:MAG: 3-hydroxyacyl-CoA dehydrogenase [Frondihabitans sp.]|jgi:3-hydroxyacyl-CoA dehydrogenase|nr:3-hydroxyacyl-CoA dehydrogenase [Frondihabitans sp.]
MSVVSTRDEGGVVVVVIDNPPVNMGNAALRLALLETFEGLQRRTDIVGVVISSALDHFYSGSDIKEFDGEVSLPLLTEVIKLIDALDVPVVAAMNGLTLGGGLEVALGCDVRITEPKAKFGLPETTLGMLPGAGGTVRLPRLVGVPKAIEMVSTGKPVSAQDALSLGLVDEIVERDALLVTAIDRARHSSKRRIRLETPPEATRQEIDDAVEAARLKGKARPNVTRAVEIIQAGVALDSDEALRRERAAFDELRLGDEARNLRYLFFAKRTAAKALGSTKDAARVSRVGIGGAGTMGSSIAAAFLGSGVAVTLFDVNAEVLDRAQAQLEERTGRARRWAELTLTSDIADLASVDLVLDAVFEELDVKSAFLRDAEAVVGESAVFATNTSYLDVNELARSLRSPGRLGGLHFFNPADRNPLVEVVRAAESTDATMASLASVSRTLGKTAIAANVGDGFVANRVYADYRGQSEIMLEDGASPEDVDAAMVQLGLVIGPFAVGDMSGLDIAWSRRKRLAATRDPEQRYVSIPDTLCEAGHLGKKTGAGWYLYPDWAPRGQHDPFVENVIVQAREAKGITPRSISAAEIQQRVLCAMVVAAATVVSSGIAHQASDIDVALTEGFAFPKWLGGPLRYAAAQSPEWLLEGLRIVYESDPIGYSLAEPASRGEIARPIADVLDTVS